MSGTEIENRLNVIEHPMRKMVRSSTVSRIYGTARAVEEALALINKAVDNGYRSPEVLLQRAELYRLHGDDNAHWTTSWMFLIQ